MLSNKMTSKDALSLFFLVIITFLVASRGVEYWPDTYNYADYFNKIYKNPHAIIGVDASYVYICKLIIKLNLKPAIFYIFLIYASLGFLLKLILIRHSLVNYVFGILIYLTHYFVIHELIQIRLGAALALFCVGLFFFARNLIWRSIISFSFSIFLHSSIIFLVVFLLLVYICSRIDKFRHLLIYFFIFTNIFLIIIFINEVNLFYDISNNISNLHVKEYFIKSDDLTFSLIKYIYLLVLASIVIFCNFSDDIKNDFNQLTSSIFIFSPIVYILFYQYVSFANRLTDLFMFFCIFAIPNIGHRHKYLSVFVCSFVVVAQIYDLSFSSELIYGRR